MKITFFGKLLYYVIPIRRHVIAANVDRVFGDAWTTAQKRQLIQAFYSHLCTSFKETIQLRFMREETLRSRVEVRGHEHVLAVAAKNRGVLVLTGHMGNWEFAPLGGMLNFNQFRGHFHFIRRMLVNKWIEKILFGRYCRAGLHVIPKQNALMPVCDALEKNHAVIFVLDQHASLVNRDGIAVEFFGIKAGTYRSLASLAQYTGVDVVPAMGYRSSHGQHVLEFFPPIALRTCATLEETLYQNTLLYNQALERMILSHPEQWWWLHKRWKL